MTFSAAELDALLQDLSQPRGEPERYDAFDKLYFHFSAGEDCAYCCEHLDAALLNLAQEEAEYEGYFREECEQNR